MKVNLNINHYIIIMLLLSVFIYIYYQTLYRVKNQNKKMNNIINSTYFKLFISCIYFVLIIIFTYETTNIEHQTSSHQYLQYVGINISNSIIFLITIFFFIYLRFYDNITSI
jgi:hypothetical protein